MGTYTTNYNLFLPSIGEQGWGELVNNNFSTIDTTMKGLDTRIGAVEPLSVIRVDENQNVTFPAKIMADEFVGGVGNFEKCYLPLSTTGKFSVGAVSMTKLTYFVQTHTIYAGSTETYNLGVPSLTSTIPSVLYNGIPPINKNVSLYAPAANVSITYNIYQGDTLIHTYAGGNTTFDLNNFEDNVVLIMNANATGTIAQGEKTASLTKSPVTFYLS